MFKINIPNIAWFMGYLATMSVIVYSLNSYRTKAIETYGTEKASSDWQEWRSAAEEMGRTANVEREAPESEVPPSLVLMRSHFGACLGISLLLTSCLYLWLMICVRGVMRPVEIHEDDFDHA